MFRNVDATGLGSFVGATALLLALLKMWLGEISEHREDRKRWTLERDHIIDSYQREREAMIGRHREDIEAIQADHAQRRAIWNRRLMDCEAEIQRRALGQRWYDAGAEGLEGGGGDPT